MEAIKNWMFSSDTALTSKSRLNSRLLLSYSSVSLFTTLSSDRYAVETYIRDSFYSSYRANIGSFFPFLMTSQKANTFHAALGFQAAENRRLFLEQYFKEPIEEIIADRLGEPISRNGLVEIGNLTSTKPGATQIMFVLLAATLHELGFKWMVFTATRQVRSIIAKLAMRTYPLGEADPSLLHDNGASWGQYYNHDPVVVVGSIPDAMNCLKGHRAATFVLSHYQGVIASFVKQVSGQNVIGRY